MFEAMTRPSTDNPDVLRFRVAIQNKVVIRRVLILANTTFKQRSIRHRGKAHAQILTRGGQFFFRNLTLHCRGIGHRSAGIVGNLEAPPMVSGHTEKRTFASINPGWQALFSETHVTRRSSEEEDLLTRWSNARRQE